MTLDDWINIAPLLSAAAIATSATVALIVFIYTRRVNRRRATLDMVMRTFLDERGGKVYDAFKALVRRDQAENDDFSLVSLAAHTPENEAQRNVVIDQLNIYELVALGIRRGLFDERFYKLWFHRQFTTDYENVAQLVAVIQTKRPSIFCEFGALYHRWKKKRHPVNHPPRFKIIWWSIIGDYEKIDVARAGMKLG